MKWKSVDGQLPPHNKSVLISDGEFVCIGQRHEWDNITSWCEPIYFKKIKYWQPLPEAPDEMD